MAFRSPGDINSLCGLTWVTGILCWGLDTRKQFVLFWSYFFSRDLEEEGKVGLDRIYVSLGHYLMGSLHCSLK